MKYLVLILLFTNIYAERVTTIFINNFKNNVKFEWMYVDGNIKIYYLEQDKRKFYLKGYFPNGEKIIGQSIRTYFKDGKKIIEKKNIPYKVYKLYCIKENDTYFGCIEY